MSSRRETVVGSARVYAWAACILFGAALSSGCSSSPPADEVNTDDPYESCVPGDYCNGDLDCSPTTLPASSGFSGDFCTSGCNSDSDCLQVPTNYDAACVNGQCYLTCPTGSDSCPYSQSCFTFDSNAGPISLCTP
jgi:hypothetical protein